MFRYRSDDDEARAPAYAYGIVHRVPWNLAVKLETSLSGNKNCCRSR